MKKQVAHIGIGFAALAALAALVLTGCVPGEAQIKVKSSELAKMAKGEIGWADVTIVASNAYPNVTMDVFPRVREGAGLYACEQCYGQCRCERARRESAS